MPITGIKLSEDPNFHFEAIRSLATARYFGSDILERLMAMSKIAPRDYEAWYHEWYALAKRVLSTVDETNLDSYSPATLYEGPGQHTLLQTQGKGFIFDWEKAVTPIVDYVMAEASSALDFIDTGKLGLVGESLGGYLAARAAAFEPRFAAVFLMDGVWSFFNALDKIYPEAMDAYRRGDADEVDRLFEHDVQGMSSGKRWFHDHLKYSFQVETGYEAFEVAEAMSLDGIVDEIKMPVFVGDVSLLKFRRERGELCADSSQAANDLFWPDDPKKVANALGKNAYLQSFDESTASQEHCQVGAHCFLNQSMYEWFAGVIGERKK